MPLVKNDDGSSVIRKLFSIIFKYYILIGLKWYLLNERQVMFGKIACSIAGIKSSDRFKKHDSYFFSSNRSVFHTFGYNQKFIFIYCYCFIPVFHIETTFHHIK